MQARRRRLETELYSPAQFEAVLEQLLTRPDSPYTHVTVKIERPAPWQTIELGRPGEGHCQQRESVSIDLPGHRATLDIWTHAPTMGDRETSAVLEEFAVAYFRAAARTNATTMLVQAQTPGMEAAALRTLQGMAEQDGAACLLMADIDHLHDLNGRHTQQRMDEALSELAALLESQLPSEVVVLQMTGGDEYLVLVPGDAAAGVRVAQRLAACLEAHDFRIGEPLTMSIGVAEVTRHSRRVELRDLKDAAEAALKPELDAGGNTRDRRDKIRRGRAAMMREGQAGRPLTLDPKQEQELALVIVKARVDHPRPFDDPWLNAITTTVVETVQGCVTEDVGPRLEALLSWLAPDWTQGGCAAAANLRRSPGPGPSLSRLDVAFAIAHALLRCVFLGLVAVDGDTEVTVTYGDRIAVEAGDVSIGLGAGDNGDTLSLGRPVLREARDPAAVDPRRAMLVRIGHKPLPLPNDLFADVLTVDDRPTFGGGLPDFWEASIARIVDRLLRFPNVAFVGVLGDHTLGKKTVHMLREASTWPENAEALAARTGMTESALSKAAERLAGSVLICHSVDSLLTRLAEVYREAPRLEATTSGATPQREDRFMQLRVDMTDYELPAHAGARIATARMAYPLALQALRDLEGVDPVDDQAGAKMIDLIDFKLQLTDPFRDRIPSFFLDDREDLEKYYEENFERAEGLFGRYLAPQLDGFLDHLANAIAEPEPFSTRRAILVIPRDLERDGDERHEIKPLGLVSIRVIPRPERSRTALYFSYTWRTVEALVGLPYSLYGSIRYSQFLEQALRARLEDREHADLVVRDLSYIAHSLHLTTDPFGQAIARRIIHLAGI